MATSRNSPTAGETTADATDDTAGSAAPGEYRDPAPRAKTADEILLEEELAKNEPARPPLKEMSGIRYTGDADVRSISSEDFNAAGQNDVQTLIWNKDNDFTVESAGLRAEVVDLILAQGNFEAISK